MRALAIPLLLLAAVPADAAPEMVLVPAGPFLRGDQAGEADERPARTLRLSAFYIDRTEVTAAAYAQCVAAAVCQPPRGAASTADQGLLPVVGVSWEDASAYCAFRHKRLPTEAEWEKAARGTDGRRYPWGPELSCAVGNFGSFQGEGRCAAQGAPGHPVPVGSYPQGASPYGALDLAGNVWEWVADRYAMGYYREAPGLDPPGPPAAPPAGRQPRTGWRVVRGGGCCSIFGLPRTTDRLALPAAYQDVDIGFRCARRGP